MRRIPFAGNANGVWDNLVDATETQVAAHRRPRRRARSSASAPDPNEARTPEGMRRILIEELVKQQGVPPHEAEFFANRLMVFLTSSDERRFGQWEHTTWWDFVKAEGKSEEYKKVIAAGLTRNLVAAKETRGQHAHDRQHGRGVRHEHHGPRQRRRARPRAQRADQRGVDRPVGRAPARARRALPRRPRRSRRSTCAAAGSTPRARATAAAGGAASRPTGSCARCRPSARAGCGRRKVLALDPSLKGMDDLFVDWMNGIQFYLRKPVDITHGHLTFIDAPWALTALTQAQFWAERDFARDYGDGTAVDCLSVDISDWDTPGHPLRQAGEALHARGDRRARCGRRSRRTSRTTASRCCPTTSSTRGSSTRRSRGRRSAGRNRNDEPLLVNTVGSWEKRPQARTKIPNLFLAGDYVQTDIDLATMEGANESGRAAVNALLDASGSKAEPREMFKLYDPPEFEAAKRGRRRALQGRASRTRSTVRTRDARRARRRDRRRRALRRARRRRSRWPAPGRRVVALDRARFPSDTLSTHLLFAGGVAELARARRARARGGARRAAAAGGAHGGGRAGGHARRYTPVDGIDYALCVRRPGLDAALVETAREAGADVRERVRVTELLWEDGRVAGRALRRTTTASASCAPRSWSAPTAAAPPSRGWSAPTSRTARNAERPRLLLRLLRGPARRVARRRRPVARGRGARHRVPVRRRAAARAADAAAATRAGTSAATSRRVRAHGRLDPRPGRAPDGCAAGDEGARRDSTPRRTSAAPPGPGWALPGDAGHFKDPVTAQGIRDALRFGRLLGEAAAPVLDDPRALDRALRALGARARARVPRDLPVDQPLARGRADDADRGRALPGTAGRPELGRECSTSSRARGAGGGVHAAPRPAPGGAGLRRPGPTGGRYCGWRPVSWVSTSSTAASGCDRRPRL